MKKIAVAASRVFVGMCFACVACGATDVTAADSKPASRACPRKLTDEQIDRILIEKLPINYDHRLTVNYADCVYGVAIWRNGGAVDSQTLIDLDADGNLPPVVVKYGIQGNTNEGPSYRKINPPPYPPHALENKIAGTVLVRVAIAADTTVSNATIMRVSPRSAAELSDGLIQAIRQWRFNPLVRYGNPLPSEVIFSVRFTIKDQPMPPLGEQKFAPPDNVTLLERIEVVGDPTR